MLATGIVSFRAHKNLKSWLVSAGQGFEGGAPELLRLILMRTAYEQTSVSGLGALFHLGKDNHQPSIGNTAVYAVRLPQSTINLIKDCANNKHQGVSEWASAALFAWYLSFKAYQESHKDADADWVEEYARLYRVRVNEVGRVYALKAGREVS